MNSKEAREFLEYAIEHPNPNGNLTDEHTQTALQVLQLAIKALGHEAYWEDVKQALNDWLNNIISPQDALNDIYRAYMGKGEE